MSKCESVGSRMGFSLRCRDPTKAFPAEAPRASITSLRPLEGKLTTIRSKNGLENKEVSWWKMKTQSVFSKNSRADNVPCACGIDRIESKGRKEVPSTHLPTILVLNLKIAFERSVDWTSHLPRIDHSRCHCNPQSRLTGLGPVFWRDLQRWHIGKEYDD